MTTVDSVQTVAVDLDGTETTDSTNLAALTLANAVPFCTHKTTINTSNWHKTQNDVELASGPDRVVVTRDSASGDHEASAAVVEFGTGVTVQSGTFSITADNTTDTEAITAVDLSAAFLVFYALGTALATNRSMTRGFFSSTTELTFERGATLGTVSGHWFVVEADAGEFDVQSWSIDMTSSTSSTDTLTAVTMASTMLVSSSHTTDAGRTPDQQGMRARLSATTTVTADRDTSNASAYTVSGFSVEFTGAEDIQRGIHTWTSTAADQTTSITAVTASLAMAWNPGPHTGISEDETGSVPTRCWTKITLDDTTTIRQSRVGAGSSSADASWEVVEWELITAAGPAPFLPVYIRRRTLNPILVR